MEARRREPCRCSEAACGRTGSADPDVRRVVAELAEAYRNPVGLLPGARKAAVYGGRGELSRGMPESAGVARRGIRLRYRSEGSRPDAGGKAGVSPDTQRAGDGRSAPMDGDSVCGT